ncbi:MAG: GMC family oxidoreductase, partial [bacterium]
GSGAAGSVLAYNLAKKTKRKVTILERGSYVVPQRDFTNRETDMLPMLYTDGGLQLTQDFDLAILQGSCVGGTTVVNNGICFRVPDEVLNEWSGLGAEIDRRLLADSFTDVEKIIRVKELDHNLAGNGSRKFVEGCKRLNLDAQWVHTNFEECGGSGYCNLGCKYNRKLSMLLNYLPMAADLGVEIVPDCIVQKIETDGHRATKLICSDKQKHTYTVTAKTVVIAAGTIASSGLLMKSGIKKNVGTRVSFNIATPMHAEFAERLNTFDGVQMCCYLKDQDCLLETTFNPPAASALIMPGWFEEHTARMTRYPYLATAAPVVGSKSNGKIKKSIFGSIDVDYAMDPHDLMRLKNGMQLLSKVFLAAGATCVMPSMFETIEIRSDADLYKIDEHVQKPEDVALSSAHPQGGNPLSDDPGVGVVDTNFKVHGYDNLYVCDASVFPTSVRVNPQLTIMAMATYAAQRIA